MNWMKTYICRNFMLQKENSEQVCGAGQPVSMRFYTMLPDSKELKHVLSDFHHYVQRVRKITLADPKRAGTVKSGTQTDRGGIKDSTMPVWQRNWQMNT